MKEKITYQEKYKKPYIQIDQNYLPKCTHIYNGYECIDGIIRSQGVIERNGERLEFQDVRLYFKPIKDGNEYSGG